MEQIGYVIEASNNQARVRVDRESACGGNCVSCKGCPSTAVIVECHTDGGINIGDSVKIIMSDRNFFKNIFWGYGLAIILMILGAVVGYTVFKTEAASVIGTALGLTIGLLTVKVIFSHRKIELTAVKHE